MSSVLLCGFSLTGTAEDLVTVAEELLRRRHQVTVLAGEAARTAFLDLDVRFVAVREGDLPPSSLRRLPLRQRVSGVFADVQSVYVEPAADQWEAVQRVLSQSRVDVVITDGLFFGAAALAYLPLDARPAVVDLGMFPLSVPDAAVPPYGFGIPPIDSLGAWAHASLLKVAAAGPYLKLTRAFANMVEQLTGVVPLGDIRTATSMADAWLQLTVPRFEYARASMPGNVRFVGALRPPASGPPPAWWDPSSTRPVVAVLNDTSADVADLVLPTLQAFADDDVDIVVSGASRAEIEARSDTSLPGSIRFEKALPWEYFRREQTVVVSTGDYVHTQYALRRGIPVVAAGTFGHQVETAARIAWSGLGIDLRTRRPDPAMIRAAVIRIREDHTIMSSLARVAAQFSVHDAESALADLVEELTASARARAGSASARTTSAVPAP